MGPLASGKPTASGKAQAFGPGTNGSGRCERPVGSACCWSLFSSHQSCSSPLASLSTPCHSSCRARRGDGAWAWSRNQRVDRAARQAGAAKIRWGLVVASPGGAVRRRGHPRSVRRISLAADSRRRQCGASRSAGARPSLYGSPDGQSRAAGLSRADDRGHGHRCASRRRGSPVARAIPERFHGAAAGPRAPVRGASISPMPGATTPSISIAAGLTPPLGCDPYLMTFPIESFWRGETHRVCDRPGAIARLLEELAAVGVSQAIIVSAVPPPPPPHRLSTPRLELRHRLGEYLAASESAALRDAIEMARLRFDSVYLIRPSHNPRRGVRCARRLRRGVGSSTWSRGIDGWRVRGCLSAVHRARRGGERRADRACGHPAHDARVFGIGEGRFRP